MRRVFSLAILVCFVTTGTIPVQAQTVLSSPVLKPVPITQHIENINVTSLKGLTFFPKEPFRFDFIVAEGNDSDTVPGTRYPNTEFQREAQKLIRYFLATLTTPEDEMWVNLSPHEPDRIIADQLGTTAMGRDMLQQDLLLKQMVARTLYPDTEIGKQFWDRVYAKAFERFGTTEVPLDTFHKVWIVPDNAQVYRYENSVFVVERHLKVMLEQDYSAISRQQSVISKISENRQLTSDRLSTEIMRSIIIPEIQQMVNHDAVFANLRQIYDAMILATWYKRNLKKSVLNAVYADQNKNSDTVPGTRYQKTPQDIWQDYKKTLDEGVFDFIREEYDPYSKQEIPRHYFSGGLVNITGSIPTLTDASLLSREQRLNLHDEALNVSVDLQPQFLKNRSGHVAEQQEEPSSLSRVVGGHADNSLQKDLAMTMNNNDFNFDYGSWGWRQYYPVVIRNKPEISNQPSKKNGNDAATMGDAIYLYALAIDEIIDVFKPNFLQEIIQGHTRSVSFEKAEVNVNGRIYNINFYVRYDRGNQKFKIRINAERDVFSLLPKRIYNEHPLILTSRDDKYPVQIFSNLEENFLGFSFIFAGVSSDRQYLFQKNLEDQSMNVSVIKNDMALSNQVDFTLDFDPDIKRELSLEVIDRIKGILSGKTVIDGEEIFTIGRTTYFKIHSSTWAGKYVALKGVSSTLFDVVQGKKRIVQHAGPGHLTFLADFNHDGSSPAWASGEPQGGSKWETAQHEHAMNRLLAQHIPEKATPSLGLFEFHHPALTYHGKPMGGVMMIVDDPHYRDRVGGVNTPERLKADVELLAKLHSEGFIHGSASTANFEILKKGDGEEISIMPRDWETGRHASRLGSVQFSLYAIAELLAMLENRLQMYPEYQDHTTLLNDLFERYFRLIVDYNAEDHAERTRFNNMYREMMQFFHRSHWTRPLLREILNVSDLVEGVLSFYPAVLSAKHTLRNQTKLLTHGTRGLFVSEFFEKATMPHEAPMPILKGGESQEYKLDYYTRMLIAEQEIEISQDDSVDESSMAMIMKAEGAFKNIAQSEDPYKIYNYIVSLLVNYRDGEARLFYKQHRDEVSYVEEEFNQYLRSHQIDPDDIKAYDTAMMTGKEGQAIDHKALLDPRTRTLGAHPSSDLGMSIQRFRGMGQSGDDDPEQNHIRAMHQRSLVFLRKLTRIDLVQRDVELVVRHNDVYRADLETPDSVLEFVKQDPNRVLWFDVPLARQEVEGEPAQLTLMIDDVDASMLDDLPDFDNQTLSYIIDALESMGFDNEEGGEGPQGSWLSVDWKGQGDDETPKSSGLTFEDRKAMFEYLTPSGLEPEQAAKHAEQLYIRALIGLSDILTQQNLNDLIQGRRPDGLHQTKPNIRMGNYYYYDLITSVQYLPNVKKLLIRFKTHNDVLADFDEGFHDKYPGILVEQKEPDGYQELQKSRLHMAHGVLHLIFDNVDPARTYYLQKNIIRGDESDGGSFDLGMSVQELNGKALAFLQYLKGVDFDELGLRLDVHGDGVTVTDAMHTIDGLRDFLYADIEKNLVVLLSADDARESMFHQGVLPLFLMEVENVEELSLHEVDVDAYHEVINLLKGTSTHRDGINFPVKLRRNKKMRQNKGVNPDVNFENPEEKAIAIYKASAKKLFNHMFSPEYRFRINHYDVRKNRAVFSFRGRPAHVVDVVIIVDVRQQRLKLTFQSNQIDFDQISMDYLERRPVYLIPEDNADAMITSTLSKLDGMIIMTFDNIDLEGTYHFDADQLISDWAMEADENFGKINFFQPINSRSWIKRNSDKDVYGGIDLDGKNLTMIERYSDQRHDDDMNIQDDDSVFDEAMIADMLRNMTGVKPVIINIQPITNMRLLLGFDHDTDVGDLYPERLARSEQIGIDI